MSGKINTQKVPACVCPVREPDLVLEGKQLLEVDDLYQDCTKRNPKQVSLCMNSFQNIWAQHFRDSSSEAFIGQMLDRIQAMPGPLTQSSEEALFRVAARGSLSYGTRLRAAGFIAKYSSAAAPAKARLMTIYIALQDEIAQKIHPRISEAAFFSLLDALEKIPNDVGVSPRMDEALFNMIVRYPDDVRSGDSRRPTPSRIMKQFYDYYCNRVSIGSPRFRTLYERIQRVMGSPDSFSRIVYNEILEGIVPAFSDQKLLDAQRPWRHEPPDYSCHGGATCGP